MPCRAGTRTLWTVRMRAGKWEGKTQRLVGGLGVLEVLEVLDVREAEVGR